MNATQIAQARGWKVVATAREGNAERASVTLHSGAPALLYVFEDIVRAQRTAWAHRPEHAAQLFVVPQLLQSGENWCLLEGIDGIPLSDFLQKSHATAISPLLAQDLGEILRKLHSTNVSQSSVFGDVLAGPRWLTFNGYVAAQFERFAEEVRRLDIDDATTSKIMQAIGLIRHELASFHPRSPTTLVHGKVDFAHVWVDANGRGIVGLTGFDSAAILPAEFDLVWLLWMRDFEADELARSLYRGYGAARTMDVQRRERFHRRLVAFHALYGDFGEVDIPPAKLIEIATS